MKDYSKNIIYSDQLIREGLYKLNEFSSLNNLTLFVLNREDKLVGTLTDGDVRRGLLAGNTIEDAVNKVMFTQFRVLKKDGYTLEQIAEFRKKKIDLVPVLDQDGRIHKIISFKETITLLPIDAVLMAGGIGERLKPLTDNIPKPLLKIGSKPVIEHNIDRLNKFGIDNIRISVRHMSEKIIDYIGDGSDKDMVITYLSEDKPLGTIGSVGLVKNFSQEVILIMNSDLLTNIDFEAMYSQFKEDNADMIVATVPYKINVPYAILEVEGSRINSLREKPTYTYYANAGIYMIRRDVVSMIPAEIRFDAPDLIEKLIENGKKVTSYPILEYWLDIGRHEDYIKAQEDINHIKL